MKRTLLKATSSFVSKMALKHFLFLTIIIPLFRIDASAQTLDRKWNLGLFGGLSTYSGNLGDGISNFHTSDFEQNLLGGITFSRYLNSSFDATLMFTEGTWGFYHTVAPSMSFKGNMLHGNFMIKYKLNNGYLISENALVAPYLLAGLGISYYSGTRINENLDYPIVAGAGIRIRITETLSINAQSTFGYMSTAHNNPAEGVDPKGNDQFLLHTLGIGLNLGAGKDEDKDGVSDKRDKCSGTPKGVKVDENGCPFDRDEDGVLDYKDKCPGLAGGPSSEGCPDSDKDGVADMDDQCPNEPGIISLKGCPDTDGDGIIDSKDKCPNVKGTITLEGCPDRDGDGIRDEEDFCPDLKGVPKFKGCPDTDGDGIEDAKDMCPLLKGTVATNGCPDTDNDGVHDGIDKCPSIAGAPTHSGCPDTDNDGVFDDIDKCKSVPGLANNQGCPELRKETKQLFQKALQGIQFETGKAVIKPISFPILNAIVKVMKENPSYKLIIEGHTDNVGEDEMNMTLSQDRASSVADYLISHGVDPLRLTATGHGETKPIDTNNSVKGRTRNRRVELSVEFLDIIKE